MSALKPIFTFVIACVGFTCSAQNTTGYENISIAQGLSQGMVFASIQDKEGFIWVATKNGLNRYDGYSFKVFNNDPYNSNSLAVIQLLHFLKIAKDEYGRVLKTPA